MKILLLDAMKNENGVANTIRRVLKEKDNDLSYFQLESLNIQPCRSCGACGHITPGKCVINDDMQSILRRMAHCDVIIMLTPVRFGGYSSELKKAVDRFMPFGLPLYFVRGGHLLHPMRYQKKFLLGVGVIEEADVEQENNFGELVAHNALNMQYDHKVLIINNTALEATIENEMANALKEVDSHE